MTFRRDSTTAQRLAGAREQVRAASSAEEARGRLQRILRLLHGAAAGLAANAPILAEEVRRVIAELETIRSATEAGDRWGLVREILALRSEGVPTHRIAHALIGLGICSGTGNAGDLKACLSWMRKQRQRWRLAGG